MLHLGVDEVMRRYHRYMSFRLYGMIIILAQNSA